MMDATLLETDSGRAPFWLVIMRRSTWFPMLGFPLIASVLVFAYCIYSDKTQMLGPLQGSLWLALALNGSIGLAIGYVGAWFKFFATKDSVEYVAMFGVKIGIYVFVFLSLVSVVLSLCKQPPTFAAYGTVAVPLFAFEVCGCVIEPLWILSEVKESLSSRRERRRLEKYVEECRKRNDEDRHRSK